MKARVGGWDLQPVTGPADPVAGELDFLDGVFPGQPIRYSVEQKGRFEPPERGTYLENIVGHDFVDVDDETMGAAH